MLFKWLIISIVFLSLTIHAALAVTVYEGVEIRMSESNTNYSIQNKTEFDMLYINESSLFDGTVTSTIQGDTKVKIISFNANNVAYNVSGDNTKYNFTGIDPTLLFYLENSFGKVKFNAYIFNATYLETWEHLYLDENDSTTTVVTSVSGGSRAYTTETHLQGIIAPLDKTACGIAGYYWLDNQCYKCNGDILYREGMFYCYECEKGFKWDGDRCILDEENFDLNQWAGNNNNIVRLGLILVLGTVSVVGAFGKLGDVDV